MFSQGMQQLDPQIMQLLMALQSQQMPPGAPLGGQPIPQVSPTPQMPVGAPGMPVEMILAALMGGNQGQGIEGNKRDEFETW